MYLTEAAAPTMSFMGGKSKLVAIDKLRSRYPMTFLENTAEPNDNRFLTFNKSPAVLSSVKRV